ncbi:MAG: Holliday junction resolvase RuvX [Eubacteriales bacterium]|jgi:putative Holliday junction resolvase
MRILGLDYGSKTVGVAVSDPLQITAQALETIRRPRETKLRQTVARVKELCDKYDVERIVLGLPVHMDGGMSESAEKALAFRDMIAKRTGLPVIMWDERLTTAASDDILDEAGIRDRHERKAVIDQIAAGIILQEYLDRYGSHADAERQPASDRADLPHREGAD